MDNHDPPLDVSNLSLACTSTFIPPTNEASAMQSYETLNKKQTSTFKLNINFDTKSSNVPTFSSDVTYSWLPASKGDIKKLAQTRFVNSSPNSYRLMPASVESSELDKTSFVEKSSHKFVLPVSYFLEVAKLWELSNRSELECQFTLAKTDDEDQTSISALAENSKKRPICHEKELFLKDHATELLSMDKTNAENELLKSVNRFLKTCEKKDKMLVLNRGISDSVGSETRRYLSQIDTLMDKTFAAKLKNGLIEKAAKESRKRSLSYAGTDYLHKRTKDSSCVNVFTVATSTGTSESEEDQFVIIHIPTTQQKTTYANALEKPTNTLNNSFEGSTSVKPHKCFYCHQSFDEQMLCAKHMLSHLTSRIQT